MSRLHNDPSRFDGLKVDKITVIESTKYRQQMIIIKWSAPKIGFGNYTLIHDANGQWIGDSEAMDKGEDKMFLELLMKEFIKQIIIK